MGGPDATTNLWKQLFSAVRASGGYPGNVYLRSQRYEWYISLALWEWTFISVPTMKESHPCCSRHRSVINDVSNTKCLWVILRETSKLCPSSIIQKRIIMSGHLVPIWVFGVFPSLQSILVWKMNSCMVWGALILYENTTFWLVPILTFLTSDACIWAY